MKFRTKPFSLYTYATHLLTGPFILGLVIPLMFLDLCVELYHRVSFPVYGLPLVDRSKYIRIDRHRLSYLNWYEKVFCTYCGYANGLLHYVSTIAGETEKYWCGIKHQADSAFVPPKHHDAFVPYDDKEAFLRAYPLAGNTTGLPVTDTETTRRA